MCLYVFGRVAGGGGRKEAFQAEGRACTGKNGTRKKLEGKLELSEQ